MSFAVSGKGGMQKKRVRMEAGSLSGRQQLTGRICQPSFSLIVHAACKK
jgi:hypothetical protein